MLQGMQQQRKKRKYMKTHNQQLNCKGSLARMTTNKLLDREFIRRKKIISYYTF